MTAEELMAWFWDQFSKYRVDHFGEDELCQCGTETLIRRSNNPEMMRATLLIAVALGQAIQGTLGTDSRYRVRQEFRLPRLLQHGAPGEARADWMISERHGYQQKMNWGVGAEVGVTMIGAVIDSLSLSEQYKLIESLLWLPERFKNQDPEAARVLEQAIRVNKHERH